MSKITKAQLRDEGWLVKNAPAASGQLLGQQPFDYFFEKGNVMGGFLHEGRIEIILKDVLLDDRAERTSNARLYLGQCEDINEFKYICKLLNI